MSRPKLPEQDRLSHTVSCRVDQNTYDLFLDGFPGERGDVAYVLRDAIDRYLIAKAEEECHRIDDDHPDIEELVYSLPDKVIRVLDEIVEQHTDSFYQYSHAFSFLANHYLKTKDRP